MRWSDLRAEAEHVWQRGDAPLGPQSSVPRGTPAAACLHAAVDPKRRSASEGSRDLGGAIRAAG